MGICFGHQVLAVAFGSEPLWSPIAWGVGVGVEGRKTAARVFGEQLEKGVAEAEEEEKEKGEGKAEWDQRICEKNPQGWEIGTRRVRLTKEGRELFGGEELVRFGRLTDST